MTVAVINCLFFAVTLLKNNNKMISEFAKEKVFWTRKMNLKLVKFIESRPNIWNPKHPKYTSVEARDKTYNEFALKYGNEFTRQAVKDRWTNIRSTFANYLRKLNVSREKSDGEEYKVNWHLWEPCLFLLKVNRKKNEPPILEDYNDGQHKKIDETQEEEQNWSTEDENDFVNNDTSDSACKAIVNNLLNVFKNVQNDAFGVDNTQNGQLGRLVARELSQMNSYDAAKVSKKIMDILLIYDQNNPDNPNNPKLETL